MDRRPDLYDEDFYLWTQAQAEALRAAGQAGGRSNAIEWDRLAEEVEDLGKSERHACESLTLQILIHLFKLSASEREAPRGHWIGEIFAFRSGLSRRLTPSIRAGLERELEGLHQDAGRIAIAMLSTEEPNASVDQSRRWTLAQILGEADDPLAR